MLTESDGCAYQEWGTTRGTHLFARHPHGFRVFLSPDEMKTSDEYVAGDPYRVETNIHNAFHRRRFRCTLALLRMALAGKMDSPRILDLGCGEGHLTATILSAFPAAEVSGLDYAVSAIDRAAALYAGIDFVVANAYRPPYAPEYFDAVVCNNLWEHVPDPLRLLATIRRILRGGAYLIISTPSRYRLWNLLRVLVGRPVEFMSPHHVTEYSVGQVIEQLRYGVFEMVTAYSEPVEVQVRTLKQAIGHRVLMPLLRSYLQRVGSHHGLESTGFFLARKV